MSRSRHYLHACLVLTALPLLVGCGDSADTPMAAPPLPVRTVRVEPVSFQPVVRMLGVVRAGGDAALLAPLRGRIRYPWRFAGGRGEGATVAAGEPLAELVNEQVAHEQSMARIRSAAADAELERWERAFAAGVEAETQVVRYREAAAAARQQLRTAQLQQARLVVRAPIAGRLAVERALPAGSDVEAGTELAHVVAGGAARVEGWAAAADRPLLVPGLAVRVLPAGGGAPLAMGMLREVAPELDAAGALRTVTEVEGGPDGPELPPVGEGVELEVALAPHPQALVVPAEAIVIGEGDAAVYVALRERGLVARRRGVQTGLAAGGRVEVLDGLRAGDRVVVEGAAFLTDGAPIVEPSAAGAGAGGPG